ncbi:MAG: hypothetical protein K6B12_07200, partial [Clostridiales bacterium]|nr:hypothetical protein [Clostridiales bacterium]
MSTANEKVLEARLNERALAQLLKENTRFLKAKAYQALGRPIDQSDDEWSVSVIAFHEAVEKYDPGKGTFHSFAGLLVKRRLWDHERAQRRQERWVVTSRDAVIDP